MDFQNHWWSHDTTGSESVSFLGPRIWDMLLDNYKNIDNLNTFKNRIKKWKPENCPCRFCKVYINNIGFCFRAKEKLGIFSSIRRNTYIACKHCFVTLFFNLLSPLFSICLWVHWVSWFLDSCGSYRNQSVNC